MSGPDSGPDISTKYQKLATEYAKLRYQSNQPAFYAILTSCYCRAQVNIIKKGLLDEQEKTSHLSDQVKC